MVGPALENYNRVLRELSVAAFRAQLLGNKKGLYCSGGQNISQERNV